MLVYWNDAKFNYSNISLFHYSIIPFIPGCYLLTNLNVDFLKMRLSFIAILLLLATQFLAAQEWENFTRENSLLPSSEVRSVVIDSSGGKWFGTDSGLVALRNGQWQRYSCAGRLNGRHITQMALEASPSRNVLWLATDDGIFLFIIDGDSAYCDRMFKSENSGLIANSVNAVVIDTGLVKWFGTDRGVSIFNWWQWRSFTVNDYLVHNFISCLTTAHDGWTYLGTRGRGVGRLRLDGFDVVTSASPYDRQWSGLASDTVYAAFIDADGNQWFGTNSGVSRHQGDETKHNWITYHQQDGLANDLVLAIGQDRRGRMWFGTAQGVSCFDGSDWESFGVAAGLAGNRVYAIACDLDGTLWLGTNAGVSHYTGSTMKVVQRQPIASMPASIKLRVHPNPCFQQAEIQFLLPADGEVRLGIYNLLGQQLRILVNAALMRGNHSLAWNGTDENGRTLPAGIYWLVIKMGGMINSQKFVILK